MPTISKPGQPKMFDIIQMSYDKKDLGFYDKKLNSELTASR